MKEGEDSAKTGNAPKAERLESANMTIVTSRKIVIDKNTGQISLEEAPEAEQVVEVEDHTTSSVSSDTSVVPEEPVDAPYSYSIPQETFRQENPPLESGGGVESETGVQNVAEADSIVAPHEGAEAISGHTEDAGSASEMPAEPIQDAFTAKDFPPAVEHPVEPNASLFAQPAPVEIETSVPEAIPENVTQAEIEQVASSAAEPEVPVVPVPEVPASPIVEAPDAQAVVAPEMTTDAELPKESTNDMERTMAQPSPAGLAEAVAEAAAKVNPQEVPVIDSNSKSNKRLSAETLFAFALPEPVLQKAIEDAKAKSAAQKKSSASSMTPGLSLNKVLIGAAVLLLVVGAGSYFLLGNGQAPEDIKVEVEKPTTKPETVPAKIVKEEVKKTVVVKPVEVAVPADPVVADKAAALTTAQLSKLISSKDPVTLATVIKEIGVRKDPALLQQVLVLAENESLIIRATAVKLFTDKSMFIEPATDKIISVLLGRLDDKEEIVRGFAARALGQSGDSSVQQNLKGRLDTEQSPVVLKALKASIEELSKKK